MKKLFFTGILLWSLGAYAQPNGYTVSNAHSHNDYEQPVPFWMAYNAGFGSIEADIFLMPDSVLLVAHDLKELKRNMKLEEAYLQPLLSCMQKNNGYPYSDTTKKLQMLIDIKTDSIHTVQRLVDVLKKYPALINCPAITWVITGNRPDQSLFDHYPAFISFDGELSKNYSKAALKRIRMLSDDFMRYSLWRGKDSLPGKDNSILKAAVIKAHQLQKPVRFWDAPDNENAWRIFMGLQVDYINTDHIHLLSGFLSGTQSQAGNVQP